MNTLKLLFCAVISFSSIPIHAAVNDYLQSISHNPNALYAFFLQMPKGGELHYHLAGGAYPESMLKIAKQQDYCITLPEFSLSLTSSPCTGFKTSQFEQQPELYLQTLKRWSLKEFIPRTETAHDHFFNAFFKFGPLVSAHRPELVADVIRQAARQQEQYLELMILPDNAKSTQFASTMNKANTLDKKLKLLLDNQKFQENINHTVTESNLILTKARQLLDCKSHPQQSACLIQVKFLYYTLREQPLDAVFAQTLNAFEAVHRAQQQHGALVGVNLVQAEDGPIALRDYHQHMKIFQFLHQRYPQVPISLHAGELTLDLATPEDLSFHIAEAINYGHAQRIGHGVDIAFEQNAESTLRNMAKYDKAVEINLTSNRKLLHVYGKKHPIAYYLSHNVPVVLSTDDEGILRTDLSSQYVAAVTEHHLDYTAIKNINRNALTYAFIEGKNLWQDSHHAQRVPECQKFDSAKCQDFLSNNPKARLQAQLEMKLQQFERQFN